MHAATWSYAASARWQASVAIPIATALTTTTSAPTSPPTIRRVSARSSWPAWSGHEPGSTYAAVLAARLRRVLLGDQPGGGQSSHAGANAGGCTLARRLPGPVSHHAQRLDARRAGQRELARRG